MSSTDAKRALSKTLSWGKLADGSAFPLDLSDEALSKDCLGCDDKRLSLQELVLYICEELQKGKDCSWDRVKRFMERYDASLGEWRRFALFDYNKRYTRNLIATDKRTFTLMLLCWTPRKESAIHDHAGSECFMRLVDGRVKEVRYEYVGEDTENEEKELTVISEAEMQPGQVCYINDKMGLHKVVNVSDQEACSLHLYIPPYDACRTFLGGKRKGVRTNMVYHSQGGKLINNCTAAR